MAHSTSHLFGYDCGTCSKPVYNAGGAWLHADRHIVCIIVKVIEVELRKVPAHTVDNVALVA